MPEHRSHGRPYIEPSRHNELPDGVQAPAQADAGDERRENGTLNKGATLVPSLGGRATKNRTNLSHKAGLGSIVACPAFEPFLTASRAYKRAQCAELSRTVGGGHCGIAASSMVNSASLQLAASQYFFKLGAETGDPKMFEQASKFADASRMNLVYAREHCAKEATARPQQNSVEVMRERILAQGRKAST